MNLNQLKYFYMVCIFGSLSEAAEHLYISQPSLSAAIKALENEFGVNLFVRSRHGMKLTPEGTTFFDLCKDLLERTEQLEIIMKNLGGARSKLRLGVPPMIGSHVLPYIYRDFCKLYPNITLEIVEDGRKALLEKLSQNHLDMIFLPQSSPLDSEFVSEKVGCFEMVCCASKDNSISKHKNITPQLLKDVPLALFENNFFQTQKIKQWFTNEKTEPKIIMQTQQLSTMLAMICQNVAVGFAFRKTAQTNEKLIAIPCQPPMYTDICLAWKKEAYNFDSMNKFKKYIKSNDLFCS